MRLDVDTDDCIGIGALDVAVFVRREGAPQGGLDTEDLKETRGDELPIDMWGTTLRTHGEGHEVRAGQTGKGGTAALVIP